ncbi:hypothetical protein OU789_13515 [Halocynthiibacter sp. C4]|uniref:hypothetical protein n=1 Tax=Halocynthiibacter sp. C4 TaxID=2992758 RepID=UPI00237BA920|nr:hypothetical protein [Halocynthiibacter sp. C4]MDE0590950.1 hypothetical protein [Halocynthiibacter sp. C4]
MKKSGNYIYATASFAVALTIGFLVQKSDAENRLFAKGLALGGTTTVVDPASVQLTSAKPKDKNATPVVPEIGVDEMPTFAVPWATDQIGGDALEPTPKTDDTTFNAYGVPCETNVTAVPGPAAMVTLGIDASCLPNAYFTVLHEGLRVSGMTSPLGIAELTLPVFSEDAKFEVLFEGGERLTTGTEVQDFDAYDRVALQWQGAAELQIHALEFGASYGQKGHVWQAAPRNSEFALGAQGGFLTTLALRDDEQAWQAEVYSFPSGSINQEGTVRLSIEAEIKPSNCGREVFAQTLQSDAETGAEVVDLAVAMPDCGAIGEVLVLNNLLRDIRIASN